MSESLAIKPTSTNEIYRFRSIKQVLCKHHEIETQTIFLSRPEQLNDPMENSRELVWKHTNSEVWNLVFGRFLHWYDQLEDVGSDGSAKGDFINLYQNPGRRSFQERRLQIQLISQLTKANREIAKYEMLMVFHFIYYQLLSTLEIGDATDFEVPWDEYFEGMEVLESRGEDVYVKDMILNHASKITGFIINHKRRWYKQGNPEDRAEYSYLPELFLNWSERHIFPKYYIACFSDSYSDATMWSHYADGHKGVCLIFGTVCDDGERFLQGGDTDIFGKYHLRKVNYLPEIKPLNILMMLEELEDWRNQIVASPHTRIWPSGYLTRFRKIIVAKTSDWRRENEYRLIWENLQEDQGQPEPSAPRCEQIMRYDFETLKGIIFGANTSDKDKIDVMAEIEKKCANGNVGEFKFYQAYFENGLVKIYEIEVLNNSE